MIMCVTAYPPHPDSCAYGRSLALTLALVLATPPPKQNAQVVNYFALVHAAQNATPPPGLLDTSGGSGGASPVEGLSCPGTEQEGTTTTSATASPSPSSSSTTTTLGAGAVVEREAERTAERKAVEAWRRKLLKEMLRSELGFNTLVKDSSLPGGGAGLGLFVEGSAAEGAVVAIYPVCMCSCVTQRKRTRETLLFGRHETGHKIF